MVKNPPAMWQIWAGYLGQGRSPGGGHSNPLQDSGLANPHGQKSLAATVTVHGVTKSRTRLSRLTHTHTHTHTHISMFM